MQITRDQQKECCVAETAQKACMDPSCSKVACSCSKVPSVFQNEKESSQCLELGPSDVRFCVGKHLVVVKCTNQHL